MALKRLNGIVQRFRSKAFSPACLFRFSESSAPLPNCDTVSGERGSKFLSTPTLPHQGGGQYVGHKRKELKKGGEMVILVLKVMEKEGDYHQ